MSGHNHEQVMSSHDKKAVNKYGITKLEGMQLLRKSLPVIIDVSKLTVGDISKLINGIKEGIICDSDHVDKKSIVAFFNDELKLSQCTNSLSVADLRILFAQFRPSEGSNQV